MGGTTMRPWPLACVAVTVGLALRAHGREVEEGSVLTGLLAASSWQARKERALPAVLPAPRVQACSALLDPWQGVADAPAGLDVVRAGALDLLERARRCGAVHDAAALAHEQQSRPQQQAQQQQAAQHAKHDACGGEGGCAAEGQSQAALAEACPAGGHAADGAHRRWRPGAGGAQGPQRRSAARARRTWASQRRTPRAPPQQPLPLRPRPRPSRAVRPPATPRAQAARPLPAARG